MVKRPEDFFHGLLGLHTHLYGIATPPSCRQFFRPLPRGRGRDPVPRGCKAHTTGGSDTGDTRDKSAASRRFARTSAGSGMPFVDMRTSP